MISRHWRGLVKPQHAEDYIKHLHEDTFPKLQKIKGFVNATVLCRTMERGIEFLVVTNWHTMRAVKQFAGLKPDLAVVPQKVQKMMIEYDQTVRHYKVVGKVES